MRRIIIAGLAMVTTLGAVLAAVLGSPASPAKATTAGTVNAATTAGTSTSMSTLMLQFNGLSCVSATFCAGVGEQGDRAHPARGDVPLTMIWNGAHSRKTATPLPKGWPEGQLGGVSCTSNRTASLSVTTARALTSTRWWRHGTAGTGRRLSCPVQRQVLCRRRGRLLPGSS